MEFILSRNRGKAFRINNVRSAHAITIETLLNNFHLPSFFKAKRRNTKQPTIRETSPVLEKVRSNAKRKIDTTKKEIFGELLKNCIMEKIAKTK